MIDYKEILFCTDFSEDADIAFLHALDLARKHQARLHVLHIPHSSHKYMRHVVDEHLSNNNQSGEKFFDEGVATKAEQVLKSKYEQRLEGFKNCVWVVKDGAPDIEIIRYAKKNAIDVIVMGALGKSEQHRLVHGSTVENVSKFAHCHVIAIRNPAKGFTLPSNFV